MKSNAYQLKGNRLEKPGKQNRKGSFQKSSSKVYIIEEKYQKKISGIKLLVNFIKFPKAVISDRESTVVRDGTAAYKMENQSKYIMIFSKDCSVDQDIKLL